MATASSTNGTTPTTARALFAAGLELARVEAIPDHYDDEAPTVGEQHFHTPDDLFPPDRLDPGDAQSDPEFWGDEWDDHTWELGPDANADPDPSADDLADFHAWREETAAREHLDQSATLKLDELAEHLGAFFETWGNGAGDLFARTMRELATKIRLTQAETPADYESRIEILDRDVRKQWEAIGFENGRSSCPCRRDLR